MRNFFLIVFFGIALVLNANANTLNNSTVNFLDSPVETDVSSISQLNETTDSHYKVVVNISREDAVAKCTVEGKVTVTTEDGDSVTIEFKVTADSCKEAMAVQAKIMEALE
ncbi:hypothetical protein [Pontibacter sp. H249]|uniref:hypothetical protein n=1 Tax=Pontibacter sp. H249 TaxID=3133420 RepID=UPI0030C52665